MITKIKNKNFIDPLQTISPDMSKKLPNLADLISTKKGKEDILSGKYKFPLKVIPTDRLKVIMTEEIIHPEKLFRRVIENKDFAFAKKLVETGIVLSDQDLVFNCCSAPSEYTTSLALTILGTPDLPLGVTKSTLVGSLHVLFLSDTFTPEMEELAKKLSKLVDINQLYLGMHNIFDFILSSYPKKVTIQKVRVMISAGLKLKSNHIHSQICRGTTYDFLTHGVDVDTLISILALFRDNQC